MNKRTEQTGHEHFLAALKNVVTYDTYFIRKPVIYYRRLIIFYQGNIGVIIISNLEGLMYRLLNKAFIEVINT